MKKRGMKGKAKRSLAILLASAMAIGLAANAPNTASEVRAEGTDKTIAGIGTSVISNPSTPDVNTAWTGSYVYFGTYNGNSVKYRVLDNNTSDFGGTTMLLDCDSILLQMKFDDDSNVWANSEIRNYLNSEADGGFIKTSFTDMERDAIANSTKAEATEGDGSGDVWEGYFDDGGNLDCLPYAPLTGEKVFLLDAKEATNKSYGYSDTSWDAKNREKEYTSGDFGYVYWWLRSPVCKEWEEDSMDVGFVDSRTEYADGTEYGVIDLLNFGNNRPGISPALNINLSSVLFTSLVSGTEYKLTLLDNNLNIATTGTVSKNGNVITVPYSITGNNATQVSVLITDKEYTASDAKIKAYGKLNVGDTFAATGSGTFTLPDDCAGCHIYIIAEDVNDGAATDYASTPVEITPVEPDPVEPDPVEPTPAETANTPTASPAAGTYDSNQNVTLSSSTDGATIYYTTDGSDPSDTNNAKRKAYTTSILIMGSEGKNVTVAIKAVAIKDGMTDSEVQTFEYKVNIPKQTEQETKKVTEKVSGSISSAITNEIKNKNELTAKEASAIVETIKGTSQSGETAITTKDLSLAMQTDTTVLNQISVLEEKITGVSVSTPSVDEAAQGIGVNSDNISMVGAKLNALGNEVSLAVSVPQDGEKKEAPAGYTASAQLDLKLNGIKSDDGSLSMPITITMPVPNGVDTSNLTLLHYHDNGIEELKYKIDNNKITFTVTSFSVFMFTKAETPGSQSGGDDQQSGGQIGGDSQQSGSQSSSSSSSGSSSSSSSSASSTQTVTETQKTSAAIEYVVKRGDCMSKIARNHGMTLGKLITLNPQVKNPSRIYAGQVLIVGYTEGTATTTVAATATTDTSNAEYYTIQKGDTLYKIAVKNKTSLTTLKALNADLFAQKYIYAGQKVRLK